MSIYFERANLSSSLTLISILDIIIIVQYGVGGNVVKFKSKFGHKRRAFVDEERIPDAAFCELLSRDKKKEWRPFYEKVSIQFYSKK